MFSFFLAAVVPPKIYDISSDITVNEGSNVSLICTASGKPQPAISWRHITPSGEFTDADRRRDGDVCEWRMEKEEASVALKSNCLRRKGYFLLYWIKGPGKKTDNMFISDDICS